MAETLQIPTSQLISDYQFFTKDSSTENVARGKRMIQHYYTFLLSLANNYVAEKTRYGNLKANQRSYLLPPDYIKMKTIRVKSGDQYYPATECKSTDRWNDLIRLTRYVTIPEWWIIFNDEGNMHLELDGIPSTDVANGIEMTFEGYQDPLSFPDPYVTGTISVTSGSATVTGSGTSWTSAMIGRFILIGKWFYEILNVVDATTLTLVNYYQGDSASGLSCNIVELLKLPPEFHMTPLWGACRDYWRLEDDKKMMKFEVDYSREVGLIELKYSSKSKGSVTPGKRVSSSQGTVPRNYPTRAIG